MALIGTKFEISRIETETTLVLSLIIKSYRSYRKIGLLALIALVGLSIQACAPNVSPQQSCNFVMSSEQQRVSWNSNVPVILYVDSSVPSEFYESIRGGIETWNNNLGREVLKLGGWTSAYPTERQDGVNVIYWIRNGTWPKDRVNADKQAVTTIRYAGDRLVEADVSINNDGFEYFSGATVVPWRVDFDSLILHELGHVLGLSHSEVGGTVMAKKLLGGQVPQIRRKPAPVDISDLKCEY